MQGDKLTIVAEDDHKKFIGVVRFWCSPCCNNKWLIEGLEIIQPMRGKGVGKTMVMYGLKRLNDLGIEKVSENIKNNNLPSIKLHENLGFVRISIGCFNSFGEFRKNIEDEYIMILNKKFF